MRGGHVKTILSCLMNIAGDKLPPLPQARTDVSVIFGLKTQKRIEKNLSGTILNFRFLKVLSALKGFD